MDWARVMKVRHDGMGIVSLYYSRQSRVLSPDESLSVGSWCYLSISFSVIITAIYEYLTRESLPGW